MNTQKRFKATGLSGKGEGFWRGSTLLWDNGLVEEVVEHLLSSTLAGEKTHKTLMVADSHTGRKRLVFCEV